MNSVEEFFVHAIRIEQEAALRFGQLADAMNTQGNREVGRLFRQLADYSKLHLADARERAGYRDLPPLRPEDYSWPDIESPEAAAIWAADPVLGREQALQVALEAEQAGMDYYSDVMKNTIDPELRALAKEFADEEAGHVAELRLWIALHREGKPLPTDV